jgi:superfamily II DNA or RNA helicase
MTEQLRDYQTALVNKLRRCYQNHRIAPLLQLATGGGKTFIFVAIAAGAAARGYKILIVVHRRELVRQASNKLTEIGVAHGIIAAGQHRDHDRPVAVAMVQTVAAMLKRDPQSVQQYDLIVLDEAHHSRAAQWRKLLVHQADAWVLGVTATPARLDGKGLGIDAGGHFDELVLGPSIKELQAGGYLCPIRYFLPPQRLNRSALRVMRTGDYNAGETEAALQADDASITGDVIEHYRRHCDHKPAIVFVPTVDYGEHIAAVFRAAGYRAECVEGRTEKQRRDELILGLGTGVVEVLASCELISEGLDVPTVAAVILLRPTASLVLYRQQIGRGMRPAPGKDALIVLDHVGNISAHGHPETEPVWTLDGLVKRIGVAWTCVCGCINPPGSAHCANCDAENPARKPAASGGGEREGPTYSNDDLVEVSAEQMRLQRAAKMRYRKLMDEVRAGRYTQAQLLEIALLRNFKRGWVYYCLREMQMHQAGLL